MQNKLPSSLRPLALQPLIRDFQTQWKNNQRFRWMLWTIAYVLMFYIALTLRDWRQPHADNLEQLLARAERLEQVSSQTQWPEWLQQEKDMSETLMPKLWQAASANLAEADLQNALRSLFQQHNAQNIRLRLAPSENMDLGNQTLIKITAEVAGNISNAEADNLFKSLAAYPKQLQIQTLSYNAQGSGQVTMNATAYFVVTKASVGSLEAANETN